jgi:hypothetical protein
MACICRVAVLASAFDRDCASADPGATARIDAVVMSKDSAVHAVGICTAITRHSRVALAQSEIVRKGGLNN